MTNCEARIFSHYYWCLDFKLRMPVKDCTESAAAVNRILYLAKL